MRVTKTFLVLLFLALSFFLQANEKGKSALIVMDMQPYFIERNGSVIDAENAKKIAAILSEQKRLIANARAAQMPIIFLEYESVEKEMGVTSPELTSLTLGYERVKVIKKSENGMFDDPKTKRELTEELAARGISHLYITGANGGACVERSIIGALDQHYTVTALSHAIADFNFVEFIYPYSYKNFLNETFTNEQISRFSEEDKKIDFTPEQENSVGRSVDDTDRDMSKDTSSNGNVSGARNSTAIEP